MYIPRNYTVQPNEETGGGRQYITYAKDVEFTFYNVLHESKHKQSVYLTHMSIVNCVKNVYTYTVS